MKLLFSAVGAAALSAEHAAQVSELIHAQGKGQRELMERAEATMNVNEAARGLKNLPRHVTGLLESREFDDKSIEKAVKILNEMIENAQGEIDSKLIECKEFHNRNRQNVEQVRTDLARYGAQISELDRIKSESINCIQGTDAEIRVADETLEQENLHYDGVRSQDEVEMGRRKNDLAVAEFIMEITKCPKSLAQQSMGHKILSCSHGDRTLYKFSDPKIQRRLEELMHGSSRNMVHNALEAAMSRRAVRGVNLMQVGETRHLAGSPSVATMPPPTQPVAVGPDPEKQSRKCTVGKANCGLLHDNMSLMWGEMKDAVDELQSKMDKDERLHDDETKAINSQLEVLTDSKQGCQTKLAEATARRNGFTEEQQKKQEELLALEAEYKEVWGECQSTLHELIYTRCCGARKVRSEVASKGTKFKPTDVIDCETTAFVPGECSSPCDPKMDGGIQVMSREITQMNNEHGQKCPVLDYSMKCNQIKCPAHCEMSSWSSYSKCTKECEGGVRSRTRSVVIEPKNGGTSCDVTSESKPCHTGSCDRDCRLHKWTKFSPCSQACDGGYKEKFRHIRRPTRGNGQCPKKASKKRYDKTRCNTKQCVGDEVCIAKQDLIIAIDGSGSLKEEGFKTLQNYTGELIKRFKGEAYERSQMKVGILQFGNGEILADKTISLPTVVSELTDKIKDLVPIVAELKWAKGFTNMAQAFTRAKTLFLNGGRKSAQSAMLVITDGQPSFKFQTHEAVQELRDTGVHVNIVTVRSSPGDELELMKSWVSVPWKTHLIHIPGLLALSQDTKFYVTETLVQSCPRSESPSQVAAAAEVLGWKLTGENMDCPSWWLDLGTYKNVGDCQNAAQKAEVTHFVFGKGPFDFYGGVCFSDKGEGNSGDCGVGWYPSSFDHYTLVSGSGDAKFFLQQQTPRPTYGVHGRPAMADATNLIVHAN